VEVLVARIILNGYPGCWTTARLRIIRPNLDVARVQAEHGSTQLGMSRSDYAKVNLDTHSRNKGFLSSDILPV